MSELSKRRQDAQMNLSDAALVQRAQKGDRGAFADLYTRHSPALARLARARSGASDVEDAVAETFVRAWKSIGKYNDMGRPFVAWLYGIGRNVIADGHRKAGRVLLTADVEADFDVETDRGVDAAASLIDLGRALGSLNGRQRTVIELKYIAGLSNDEVGASLGIAPGAVNTLQWRALRKLQTILEVEQ